MTRTRTVLASLLATGLLTLSACGGADDAGEESRATQPAAVESAETSPVAVFDPSLTV